ncbi:MAG: hypothetical protein JWM56_1286 [Candidatus Peribacteria bacterium]|nr:hypothetical protein [Candidatus Peribacteria bacterium]
MVEQIRLSWNTLIPYMKKLAAIAQEKIDVSVNGKSRTLAVK